MTATREPTEALLAARRSLESVAGCQIIQDFRWFEANQFWALHLRLMPPGLPATELVPACTDWFLTAEHDYPSGGIGLYPSKEGGLTRTFWHQRLNVEGPEDEPWRRGNICTETIVRALHRHGFDREPRSTRDRLLWHVHRALAWLMAAAQGELIHAGDFYELPTYPGESGTVIGFAESPENLQGWFDAPSRAGVVDLVRHPRNEKILVARRFATCDSKTLAEIQWGSEISRSTEVDAALWFLLNEAPVLSPWQPPMTWSELQEAAGSCGVNLFSFLRRVPQRFRNARSHILLIGFPIPRRFGEAPERMHWLAARLPILSYGKQTIDGFRGPHGGWEMRDRQVVFSSSPLEWLVTENWAEDEISSRGRFSADLRGKWVLLIGAGALGSAVAELLVRGGVHRITIVDPDDLQAGNLVRHSLTMTNLGTPKGAAVAEWLNLLSPHARVEPLEDSFPPADPELIAGADMIIDCTGEDDLLARLSNFPWPEEKNFVSFSLGMYARRLFLFTARSTTFPRQAMIEQLQPWLREERASFKDEDLPWESIGCWHPIFPARVDDVRLFAALAVRNLDQWVENPGEPTLAVLERDEAGTSVCKVQHG